MADYYDSEDLLQKAKEAAIQHKLLFIEDVVAFLPCSKATFYAKFPAGSDGLDAVKEIIDNNKCSVRNEVIQRWSDPEAAPALQMGLVKMIGTQEMREALGNANTHKVEYDPVKQMTDDELRERLNELLGELKDFE